MTAAPETIATAIQERGKTSLLPGQTPEGKYILSVLLKRTYDIVPNQICTRASTDKQLFAGDMHWDDPMNSSVRYESDFIPFKLATDVVLNGKAYAPGGVPTTSCFVSLQVGGTKRQILVTGDRAVTFVEGGVPRFTDPSPFIAMDLRYELAYGGIDVYSDKKTSYPYPRNPMGRGFVVNNSARSLKNLALPNLEDPDERLTPEKLCLEDYTKWEQQPFPAGFGWFPKTWRPRALWAGILPADRAIEQQLRQEYAKLLSGSQREAYLANPLPDMDFRFFNGASRGLVFPFLRGGERVVTENLSQEGALSFSLPSDSPRIGLDIGSGLQESGTVMHSAMIRMEDRQVDLIWRAANPYEGPEWLPQMRKMEVLIA
jgi:hypothetical protein